MQKRQRLVVCLDGTWNNRDDNTNVLHHFALIREGNVPYGSNGVIFQSPYYHPGVGTGVLDRVSGGAFGFGLEQNVRDAYNWLIQNFEEGNHAFAADEIYIFGFSRGAYTARSLVGFIGRCGLLRRGAPLTITQLWEQYCLLGREHEERGGRLEKAFGETPTRIRQITDLICDPWQIDKFEKNRAAEPKVLPDAPDRVPGQRENDLNDTEKLLVRWSRRVRITYLGVYDTVGAMGIDALAIPVLKSKLALHHNMRPTTLIQSCRHALAMDEHRSSFRHTPFTAYVGHETAGELQERGEAADNPQHHELGTEIFLKQDWQRTRAMWRRKIEQRWFVGAHSNVGGGYPDNRLALQPFAWMLQGAMKAGLVFEDMRIVSALASPLPQPRDSFAEFAKPFWTMLFRAKPYYRLIDPEPELRASPSKGDNRTPPPGFAFENIHEQVDPSVFEYWGKRNRPPNLAEYATRKRRENKSAYENNPAHPWLGNGVWAHAVLVLWATLAALGVAAVREFVLTQHGASTALICLLSAVAFVFALVDWGESKANFSLALGWTSACRRAFRDSIYWTRAIGVVLFVVGAIGSFNHLWQLGWNEHEFTGAWSKAYAVAARWWSVPVGAGLGVMLASLINTKVPKHRIKAACGALIGGPAVAIAGVLVIVLVTGFIGVILTPLLNLEMAAPEPPAEKAAFAGLLLLLQLSVMCCLKAFSWCGEPMTNANLRSVIPLQLCATPRRVQKCLDNWCHRLTGRQPDNSVKHPSPECSMSKIVSEALWRDIIGLIPVYTLVLSFGLWFAGKGLEWNWLLTNLDLGLFRVPWWLLVPIAAAIADYIEGFSHLYYLKLHAQDRLPQASLTMLSFAATVLKSVTFTSAAVLTCAAIVQGSWLAALYSDQVGWKGLLAFSVTFIFAMSTLSLVLGVIFYRLYTKRKKGTGGISHA